MNRRTFPQTFILILIFVFCAVQSAATAADAAVTLRVPKNFPTIQQAIDAAPPGSMIVVSKGVFPESLSISKNIIVRGMGPEETIIDGQFLRRVVDIGENCQVRLQGLTICRGLTPQWAPWEEQNGGGIRNQGQLEVIQCVIRNNYASDVGGGGGIYSKGSLTLHKTVINANSADAGGGICLAYGGTAIIKECTIEHNYAAHPGGGIFVGPIWGSFWMVNSSVSRNVADGGAGIAIWVGSVNTLIHCDIISNHSTYNAPAGIDSMGPLIIINCTLEDNVVGPYD